MVQHGGLRRAGAAEVVVRPVGGASSVARERSEHERAIHFRIDAMLKVEPEPEPVTFDSLLKLDTKSFVVRGDAP